MIFGRFLITRKKKKACVALLPAVQSTPAMSPKPATSHENDNLFFHRLNKNSLFSSTLSF